MISREDVPRVIDWGKERKALAAFMETMPFKLPLDVPVRELAAGEKQKLEIIKQLYLGRHFLVLDEPTSVLTPGEATEVLGLVRGMTERGDLTVLMISHKFHEVTAFADDVTVLRKGKLTGHRQGRRSRPQGDGRDDDRRPADRRARQPAPVPAGRAIRSCRSSR